MHRLLSCFVLAGLLAVPAVASAEPQYVWVRYGSNNRPYVYVTTEPRPAYPDPGYVRADGLRFDSDVGAACGALHTDVYFAPTDSNLDPYDRSTLASIASCMTRGAMAGIRVELVAAYDGSYASLIRSDRRLGEVIDTLKRMGVSANQMVYSREILPGWQSDRISFRMAQPYVWPYQWQ